MDFTFLPGFLKNLVLSYNASIVRSETWIYGTELITNYIKTPTGFPPPFDSVSVPVYSTNLIQRKQKLEGQPEFYANVSLGYDIGGLSVRLSMFHQAEYNASFSALGTSDGVNSAFTRFDLAFKYEVTRYLSVMLNFNNLTDIDERNTLYNRDTGWKLLNTSENYGRTADLGIRLGL
jgi:outer membrane receptor protein involved in Fe transport